MINGFLFTRIRYFFLIAALAGAGAAPLTAHAATSPQGNQADALTIVEASAQNDVLELLAPVPQIVPGIADGQACQVVQSVGFSESNKSGWPVLPVKGAMLGIPAQSNPTLIVQAADMVVLPGHYNLCPAAQPVAEFNSTGEIQSQGEIALRDAQVYASNAFYPQPLVEVVDTAFIRSQRVAELRFQPFQYNPVTGELRYYRRVQMEVSFNLPAAALASAGSAVDEGPFETALHAALVNYTQSRSWRVKPVAQPVHLQSILDSGQPSYKIRVNQDGIYQVTYADLATAGTPVDSIDPRTFQLFDQGSEVAIYVEGEADGHFDTGDYVLFYGQKMNTRYTDTNVYWLTWGSVDGLRMLTSDGTPDASVDTPLYFQSDQRVEEDNQYKPGYPSGPDQDRWYWDEMIARGKPVSENFSTTLVNVSTQPSLTITVSGILKGFAATPQHHTQIYLNDHLIDDATWAPSAEYDFKAENVPQSDLLEGTNTITVSCPLGGGVTYDYLFVNRFEIDYNETYTAHNDLLSFSGDSPGTWQYQVSGFSANSLDAFDITDPVKPVRILNAAVQTDGSSYDLAFQQTTAKRAQFIALSSDQRLSPLSISLATPPHLHNVTNSADYIIITHADFYTQAQTLAAYRATQGLRTEVVNVQDIYDEFSAGIFDPQAIHDFLAYAYANWQPPAPAYVLLMGDGNYDFKNNTGRGEPNYIPPYLVDVDPTIRETAADNRYVCVSGDDNLPDMAIGRFAVKTTSEADAMVTNVINYEQHPPSGNWNQQALFVADLADAGGDFAAYSNIIADNYLPAPYLAQKVYYGVTNLTAASTKAAILAAVNSGRLVVNYVGHGSIQSWSNGNILTNNDLPSLTNSQMPFIISMTCVDGYYIHPSPPGVDLSSLEESVTRMAGKGAIASWAATGLETTAAHDYLDRGMFTALFSDHITEIGLAADLAKYFLYANTAGYQDLVDTYVLFGDPALHLNTLPLKFYLPIIIK